MKTHVEFRAKKFPAYEGEEELFLFNLLRVRCADAAPERSFETPTDDFSTNIPLPAELSL